MSVASVYPDAATTPTGVRLSFHQGIEACPSCWFRPTSAVAAITAHDRQEARILEYKPAMLPCAVACTVPPAAQPGNVYSFCEQLRNSVMTAVQHMHGLQADQVMLEIRQQQLLGSARELLSQVSRHSVHICLTNVLDTACAASTTSPVPTISKSSTVWCRSRWQRDIHDDNDAWSSGSCN